MSDPEPTLDEPDTDVEVIWKLRERIEVLEAALREIVDTKTDWQMRTIARTALGKDAKE